MMKSTGAGPAVATRIDRSIAVGVFDPAQFLGDQVECLVPRDIDEFVISANRGFIAIKKTFPDRGLCDAMGIVTFNQVSANGAWVGVIGDGGNINENVVLYMKVIQTPVSEASRNQNVMIMPTSVAVVQVAMVPARMDFIPISMISTLRSGPMVTRPVIMIPRLTKFANPHSA
jgi:hypothetical protein